MNITKANKKGIRLAVKYLREGKSVVYPTDTAYGLGVDATNPAAVKRLIKIKNRPKQPIHVIVENFSIGKKLAIFDKTAERLFKKFMPGPLTLVLRIKSHESRALKLLSAGTGTIGIRMPDNKVALELVRKLGRPITTPSANPHGGETPHSVAQSYKQFSDKKHQPDLYLDAGKLPKRRPSTMVRVENGRVKILRKGPISKKQIQQFIRSIGISFAD